MKAKTSLPTGSQHITTRLRQAKTPTTIFRLHKTSWRNSKKSRQNRHRTYKTETARVRHGREYRLCRSHSPRAIAREGFRKFGHGNCVILRESAKGPFSRSLYNTNTQFATYLRQNCAMTRIIQSGFESR